MGYNDHKVSERVKAVRARKGITIDPRGTPGPSHIPTAFSLRKESDVPATFLDSSEDRAGSSERELDRAPDVRSDAAMSAGMIDSNYGVQSLSDALNDVQLEASAEVGEERRGTPDTARSDRSSASPTPSPATSRKRKAGNPVHPKIAAAGQRILSSESGPGLQRLRPVAFNVISSASHHRDRFGGDANDSPQTPSSGVSSTPGLEPVIGISLSPGSPRSIRLSDDDGISFDDSVSQAVLSSSEDDDGGVHDAEPSDSTPLAGPQLVMPSVPLSKRREATRSGRELGSLRLLFAGRHPLDHDSMIKDFTSASEDILHVDPPTSTFLTSRLLAHETRCSTRSVRTLGITPSRTPRVGHADDRAMQRNISITSTSTGEATGDMVEHLGLIHESVEIAMRRTLNLHDVDDYALESVLSTGGTFFPDLIVLFVASELNDLEIERVARLSQIANVTLTHALSGDGPGVTSARLARVTSRLDDAGSGCVSFGTLSGTIVRSNQIRSWSDDQMCGELSRLLFKPSNAATLRHEGAQKLLHWRQHPQVHVEQSPLLPTLSALPSDISLNALAPPTQASTISSPCGVLVPRADSSFYRPASPVPSGHTIDSASEASNGLALAPRDGHQGTEKVRTVRIAKWAEELQKSLESERRRLVQGWMAGQGTQPAEKSVVRTGSEERPAAHGTPGSRHNSRCRQALRYHGPELDAHDPLGLLRMRQRFRKSGLPKLLRALGIGGLVGTVTIWLVGNREHVRSWWWLPLVKTARGEQAAAAAGGAGAGGAGQKGLEYAMGCGCWSGGDARSLRAAFDQWGLRDMVDRAVGEVGRLRPVGW